MAWRLPWTRNRDGRLRNTLLFNLALIGLIAAAALFVLLGSSIQKSFSSLEQRELEGHLGRISDFQKTGTGFLLARAKDWGVWDDSYVYAQKFDASYEANNVNIESFRNARVDGLAIVRLRDGTGRGFAFDRTKGTKQPGLARALLAEVTRPDFMAYMRGREDAQSFAVLDGQLYTIASVQIHKSNGGSAPPGFLTFVQKVTAQMAEDALQVPAGIDLKSRITTTQIVRAPNTIEIAVPFKGRNGKTVAAIQLHMKRPLTQAAHELLLITFAGVFSLIALLLTVLNRRVKTLVLDPVERLHKHVSRIRESRELQAINTPAPANEFGALQAEFNRMTAELLQLRAQLESQSFTLGKSQSAMGLIHNLRNGLSPVRVILETLDQNCRNTFPPQMQRALDELSDGTLDQERRDKLISFLTAAHEHAAATNSVARQQVREAARNLMNAINAIDAAAQNGRDIHFDERCDLSGLLSHSANIARYADNIAIAADVQCNGHIAVSGNRVLLSQVLENLVTNALEAIRESGRQDGAISLQAAQNRKTGICTITVADNGAGFAPETAPRLFERGFSTRTSKSGGLGLHWCANTVQAMNGELQLESRGKGRGARAIIRLPLWQNRAGGNKNAA
ncbi:sensor histidine kinase [Novosphingobium beihaiensis]|uniref:histidine kinase n=1 Tax=Novosphingobium beihaiensis TaxID=2930389 RepID=A0ABT0BLZ5_9SPHN|nr:ATP-binding protein [Novosphingobium beihaiensis]MCJ2185729.1 ATP-binding protein [Novosphingobium beihaiensis]